MQVRDPSMRWRDATKKLASCEEWDSGVLTKEDKAGAGGQGAVSMPSSGAFRYRLGWAPRSMPLGVGLVPASWSSGHRPSP